MLIDATNLILGRVASHAAKQALLGEQVNVINCSKALVSGNRKQVIAGFLQKIHRGIPTTGPFYPKRSEAIVKRTIRGMLPHRQPKGIAAFKRIRCYSQGGPEGLGKPIDLSSAGKSPMVKYTTVGELAKLIGGSS
jgi:large subunit ribosomal protein L13